MYSESAETRNRHALRSMGQLEKNTLIETYLEQRPALKRFLIARFRDSSIAEDILQEIYLKLTRSDMAKDIENQTAYLFRVANNLALDFRKQKQRSAARDHEWSDISRHKVGDEPVHDAPSPERILDAKRKIAKIQEILAAMPPQRRKVFVLHKLEGHSHAEIAAMLGITRSTTEKHMSKALKTIAKAFGRQD